MRFDRDHPLPRRIVDFTGREEAIHDARDVGQHVDAAIRGRDQCGHGGLAGDVARNGSDVARGRFAYELVEARLDMSVAITSAPSCASRFAVARPMPDPAPVTRAVFPVNRSGT